ncbi:unnamed protein product [Bemisia tabaci]|uniref:SWI/SNF-related matrix-associated actin-dependent regulator of chromatin subfamily A containing DEAD/H box 1 homolog n=1 Tax=Bemisia tabaci TaxID=7038 RepID=A0A9P0CE89_BEMTA|nr:unnamed protein product [Bemisia tabaci]
MSGSQSSDSSQCSPSILSSLERFKHQPKTTLTDYFGKKPTAVTPLTPLEVSRTCNGTENESTEEKHYLDLDKQTKPEIPNGHIRPNFADPLAKIGYGINSSHPGFKSPSSLYFEGSPQPLAQPSPKPLHKSTLDKLKNFRKNFSAKQRTSDRSEDVTKSSTSKADVSGPGSSESYQSSSSSSGHSSKDGNHDLSKKSSEDSTRKIETISDSDSNPSPSKNTPSTPEKTTLTGSSFGSPKTFNDTFASFVQQKASENQQYQHNVAHCSDDSPVKSIKKKRKVVINDDSSEEEEEEPIEKPKKKRRVVQESVSDSDEESSKKSKKKAKKQKQIIERDSETEEEMTDSDEYVPEELTSTMKIMSFLSESPLNDLKQVPSMTQRKIDIITAKRPFNDWFELVTHLRENSIPLGLLENVSDLLRAREAFSSLIKRVSKISEKTQLTIKSNEGKMTKQPLLLSPELQLSDYQVIGVNWLAVLHSLEMGGILADEMGLGKTVQVISFLAYLKEQKLVEHPHLIVVPSSTLANWENEFRRWCPSIGFQVYHGTLEERREMRYFWNKEGFGDTEVILSTYNCVGNNPEDSKFTKTAKFHYVVFDEAHMLKNMNTQRYSRLFLINAKNRLLLTGTPLQNNLLELMSLLNFTMPQVFRQNMESVKFILGKSTKPITEDSPDFEKEKVDQVKKIMEPFVLRRLKRNVLKHLPRKDVSVIKCTMVPEQASKYNELLAEFKQTEKFENLYMTMITSLRKMANHPLLLRYHYDDGKVGEMAECLALDPDYKDTNVEYIIQDLVFMSDYELHQLSDNFKCLRYDRFKLPESLFLESGKFRKFDEVLPNLKREGHRVLIFSQFLMVLDLIEKYLTANDHTYKRLDGSTPVVERQELIDTFNKDPSIFCFLLSTRAGGLGINLTAADTVIIHDIDINPYNDKQAEDRCHRVGQTRPVTVLKLISEDTLEEDLYKVTEAKLNLEQEVTGEVDEAAEKETFAVLLRRALGLEQNTAENKS